jgi:hypothetical protein
VLPLAALTRDAQNPRRRTDRGAQLIADSLKAFGAARSIVIDETNTILAGNGVIDAAALAGLARVQVVDAAGDAVIAVRRRNLTPAQKRALTIADNRTSELAIWDADAVRAAHLEGVDLAQFWSAVELHQLIGVPDAKAGLTDPNAVPPLRSTTIQRGDLFVLGDHRLLCGDSTKTEDVARLLAGRTPTLMITDPPYGVQYDPAWRARAGLNKNRQKMGAVANDQRADWTPAWRLFPGHIAYVCGTPGCSRASFTTRSSRPSS